MTDPVNVAPCFKPKQLKRPSKKHYKVLKNGYSCFAADVTLTFRRLKQKGQPQYDMPFRKGMIALIKWLASQDYEDYIFYPEYGSNHKLHFHGTVYYRNVLRFHAGLNDWIKTHGFVDSKGIKSDMELLRWHWYTRKDAPDNDYLYICKHNAGKQFLLIYSYVATESIFHPLEVERKNDATDYSDEN